MENVFTTIIIFIQNNTHTIITDVAQFVIIPHLAESNSISIRGSVEDNPIGTAGVSQR